MRSIIHIGRVAEIPIGVHYSWIVIATLITMSLGAHFSATNPEWRPAIVWSSAAATALLFFASLIAHELSHALVARSRGLPVRSITLFALGGLAHIEKDARSAKTEFWVAIAGPITSLLIGFGCVAAAYAMGWSLSASPDVATAILGWLGWINVVLAIFNLIPGYPLDGGRVLRSIIWAATGDADRATRAAAIAGQAVAGLFMALGLLRFFAGAGFGGLWLAFIGWFLLDAARASYQDVAVTASLRGVHAGDVMTGDCDTVDGGTALVAFVDRLLRTGSRCFVVTRDGGDVVGLITPREVRAIDRSRWPEVRVADAMQPLDYLHAVSTITPVAEVLQMMGREDLNQLPVMADGHLAGVITRSHLLRLIQTRTELTA